MELKTRPIIRVLATAMFLPFPPGSELLRYVEANVEQAEKVDRFRLRIARDVMPFEPSPQILKRLGLTMHSLVVRYQRSKIWTDLDQDLFSHTADYLTTKGCGHETENDLLLTLLEVRFVEFPPGLRENLEKQLNDAIASVRLRPDPPLPILRGFSELQKEVIGQRAFQLAMTIRQAEDTKAACEILLMPKETEPLPGQ